MLYPAVPLHLFKSFKFDLSPLKILIGTASEVTKKDSVDTTHYTKSQRTFSLKIIGAVFKSKTYGIAFPWYK